MEKKTKKPTPNPARASKTRSALKSAARALFLKLGYADTGTEQIVRQSGVTRGALYYHYSDKCELFAAIIEEELAAVAELIETATANAQSAIDALHSGSEAFIAAMAERGRTRLVLLEAPTVLGRDRLLEIENRHTRGSLADGLRSAIAEGSLADHAIDPLVEILSAAFDGAALSIEAGMEPAAVNAIIRAMFDGLK